MCYIPESNVCIKEWLLWTQNKSSKMVLNTGLAVTVRYVASCIHITLWTTVQILLYNCEPNIFNCGNVTVTIFVFKIASNVYIPIIKLQGHSMYVSSSRYISARSLRGMAQKDELIVSIITILTYIAL